MLAARPVRFEYPDDFEVVWSRRNPEIACVANAVSLSMPYVEPLVVRATRDALAALGDTALAGRARAYAAQEANHLGQHRRLNERITARHRTARLLERVLRSTYAGLERQRLSSRTGLAAGFETVAFAAARWVDPRADRLFAGADPVPAGLFLWHLAEEAEHRGVAYDVHRAAGGTHRSYLAGLIVAFVLLGGFTLLASLALLAAAGRWWRPVAWWRLASWSLSFLFHGGGLIAVSALASHHPDDFDDPARLSVWLDDYDAERRTLAPWPAHRARR